MHSTFNGGWRRCSFHGAGIPFLCICTCRGIGAETCAQRGVFPPDDLDQFYFTLMSCSLLTLVHLLLALLPPDWDCISDLILVLDLTVHSASLIPLDNPQRDCRSSDWWPWLRLVWLVTTRPLRWWSNFRLKFKISVSLMQNELYCIILIYLPASFFLVY